ncbi:universal stress protein [Tenacibaculum sp. nBUS_03]|uniref:universal stress protein n=1 Tax=Tenacibaculum sp. nBUS_03 TaxID=3395320 RepID=UPI003EB7105E
MKKILIPIDFSKHSEYACVLASKIAKKSNSEVHLLHMVELPSGIIDMGPVTILASLKVCFTLEK